MKKIVASVGLVALGASSIQSASGQAVTSPDASKPWSVSATLRGFYDDNPATLPNDLAVQNRDSFGFEISPSAALAWSVEQTTLNLGLLYAYKYYDTIPFGSTGHDDQVFTFNAGLTHAFSEQVKVRVNDAFVIGQEPDLLRAGNTYSTFQRVSGDNIRNYGSVGLDAQLTPKVGLGFGYDNSFYDYKDTGATLVPVTMTGPNPYGIVSAVNPSLAGILNRIEQRAHLEGLLAVGPETKGLVGYQFSGFDYNANELIGGYGSVFFPGTVIAPVMSNARNTHQHTFYVGAEHNFSPELTGSLRGGASYTEYYNDPQSQNTWSPYVNGSLKYTYAPESSAQIGLSYDRSATDVVGPVTQSSGVVTDAGSFVVFGAINHRLASKLYGSLIAQFQNSDYHGGAYDGKSEQFYTVGVNLEYRFSQYFSADVGYNYDLLQSGIPYSVSSTGTIDRGFDRNRVYIGVTATY